MHKIWLIVKREYSTRVKKKSFVLLTVLVPVIVIGFYALIIGIAIKSGNETETVAVIDRAELFQRNTQPVPGLQFEYVSDTSETNFRNQYRERGYKYFLFIPDMDINNPVRPNLYYAKALGLGTQAKVEAAINSAITKKRWRAEGLDDSKLNKMKSDISVVQLKGTGDRSESLAAVNSGVGYSAGILIYFMLFIYGSMVMRGVMEEKTNRIAEVIISSAKPFQLMLGKIIGIGGVGLTQFLIWILLVFGLQLVIPLIFPEIGAQMKSADAGGGGMLGVVNALKALPFGMILFTFIFYFIGGYMMYAALFAAVGSMVNEDPQEAQQLIFPITMPIILSFVIMTQAVNQPDSQLAIFGSLFPLTSPIVMMGRISYGVPLWQLLSSMAFLVIGFLGTTWLAGRIYRTGILMYGKKPSLKEMVRWAFRRS